MGNNEKEVAIKPAEGIDSKVSRDTVNEPKKAFWLSFASGLAEPVGALVGYLILMPFLGVNNVLMGIIFASVAGIMVFISLDELLPAAEEYGEHHLSIYGLLAGMAVMAVSLLMFI